MNKLVKQIFICAALLNVLSACSYQFQGQKNPLKEIGIEKVYIELFGNYTYRPGLEEVFTSALLREFQKNENFKIVSFREEADAVLTGTVDSAEASIGTTTKYTLGGTGGVDVSTGSEYLSSVSCTVVLKDKFGKVLFSQSIGGGKVYSAGLPAANASGDAFVTTSLVNESEQRMAVHFLATQMMASVYQRLIDTF